MTSDAPNLLYYGGRRLWLSVAAATGAPVGGILVVVGVYALLVAGFGHTAVGGDWVLALLLALPVGVVMMVAAPFVGARLSGHPRPMMAGAVAEVSAFGAFVFTAVVWDIPPRRFLPLVWPQVSRSRTRTGVSSSPEGPS